MGRGGERWDWSFRGGQVERERRVGGGRREDRGRGGGSLDEPEPYGQEKLQVTRDLLAEE